MPDINKVLFVQHPSIIDKQSDEAVRVIETQLGIPVDCASSPEHVPEGAEYDVVIAPTLPWLDELLARLPYLRWVHFLSAGVEKIWAMNFDWHSIQLSKSSGVHAAPMSEYAIGAMLHFAKEFDRYIERSRNRRWQRAWLGELTDKNLIVFGMGSVGTAVADRAAAFGMNILGIATKERADFRHRVETLESSYENLTSADYVVLTAPLTSQTRGLANEDFFLMLKRGAVLIDISRGGIVQPGPLVAALDSGQLRGAALDVFEDEPLNKDSPLWARSNVLLTPHVAGTTPHYLRRALDIFIANARLYKNNERLRTAVDPKAGY
jgi:phosphoglycerate dehydrogenase-like enzyme